jgi:hypothetical protein
MTDESALELLGDPCRVACYPVAVVVRDQSQRIAGEGSEPLEDFDTRGAEFLVRHIGVSGDFDQLANDVALGTFSFVQRFLYGCLGHAYAPWLKRPRLPWQRTSPTRRKAHAVAHLIARRAAESCMHPSPRSANSLPLDAAASSEGRVERLARWTC